MSGALDTVEPRQRLLESAYALFSRRGVRAVGVDEVIERAAVAKATLYRHFPSKNELVLAFLRRREELWTHGWVESEARRRGGTPEESLLAIFDLFDEWFQRDDFEGCSFVNVLGEDRMVVLRGHDETVPGNVDAVRQQRLSVDMACRVRKVDQKRPPRLQRLDHCDGLGEIVGDHDTPWGPQVEETGGEGDRGAAKRAQALARLLVERHR